MTEGEIKRNKEGNTWRMSDKDPFPREVDVPVKSRTSSIN